MSERSFDNETPDPATASAGDREPPRRDPPGAVGGDASADPPPPPRDSWRWTRGEWEKHLRPPEAVSGFVRDLFRAADRAAEGLDPLGDRIASALRIRERSSSGAVVREVPPTPPTPPE